MDPYKLERQNSTLRKALSELVTAEIKDPRVVMATISEVRLNRDQSVAEVFVSVIGEEQDRIDSLRGLRKARGFLQGRLADLLRLRRTPDLRFVLDESLDRGLSVDALLDDLKARGEFDGEEARTRGRSLDSLEPPRDLLERLARCRRPWIVPHHNPDPDAMGSALALGRCLRLAGKDAEVLSYPEPPAGFAVLPGIDETLPADEAADAMAASPPDLVVMVDCHELERAEELAGVLNLAPDACCVDHHLTDDGAPALPGWIEPVASSASLLVMRVIEALDAAGFDGLEPCGLDADMAACIYGGLVADTGGFRFPNTLPLSFEAARRLAEFPIDVAELSERLLHLRTRPALELMKHVTATFAFHAGGRILSLRVTGEMLRASGASLADTEGFVNLATAVDGVRFVVFLKERGDGSWRVSLRAKGDGDVQAVAAARGGGGHRLAAGCTLEGEADAVLDDLLHDLAAQLEA